MKKYHIKLGAISIVTLPLLSMVSCDNGSLQSIDLEINVPKDKNITQENINRVADQLQVEGILNSRKVVLLNEVFENVDEGKINHFKIQIENNPSNAINQIILLQANDGFIFGDKKVLRSQEVKIPGKVDLNIQALGGIDQRIIDQAIKELNSNIILEKKVISLNTVFRGVTTDNINNFDITATPTNLETETLGTIVLTAKTGFSFNGQDTLTSWLKWNLKIEVIPKLQRYIDYVIDRWNNASNTLSEKVEILSMIFGGVTQENINNFDVKVTPTSRTTPGKVTLTTKPGFTFNGYLTTLTSIVIPEVDLGLIIKAIPKPQENIDLVIRTWNNALAISEKVQILSTIFEGINQENINNFDVEKTPTSGTTLGIVTLIAKEGFNFSGNQKLSSKSAPLIVDLKIGHQIVNQSYLDIAISYILLGVDPFEVLSIGFTGITRENIVHLEVKATATIGETPGTILLTAKPGFTINGKPSLLSMVTNT